MKSIFSILIIASGLLACKKDKLTGELAVFEGRWKMEWYVKKSYYPSIQNSQYDTITNLNDSYEMVFEKKGKVRFIKNGEEIEKYRILLFLQEGEAGCTFNGISGGKVYNVTLNNESENFINGCISSTSLYAARDGFPFSYHDEGAAHVTYRCYFKKQ